MSEAIRRLVLAVLVPVFGASAAAAAPASFTYQGNLWQDGVPVTAPKPMTFKITDSAGTSVYWSTGPFSVDVVRGHFAVTLAPAGVAWESASPYIEVTVDGNVLLPREPINAVPFAFHADTMERAVSGTADPAGTPGRLFYRTDTGRLRLYNGGWVDIAAGNDNPWLLSGTDVYYTGGRVGIGTATPQSALHVVDGDLRISSTTSPRGIYFPDGSFMASAGAGSASSLSSNSDILITGDADANASGGVILRTGSTDRLIVANNGQVGIGVLTPTAALDVSGTVKATAFQGGGAGLTGLLASNVAAGSFAAGAYTFPGNLTVSGNLGANLNAGGFRVTNLGSPSGSADAATKGYVDAATGALGAAALASTQTFTGLNTFANQVSVSSNIVLTGQLVAGSGAVAITTPGGLLDASKLSGTVPNAAHDPSSVTLQGNTFNVANRLVRLNLTGGLPAVSGGLLTNLSPANMDPGTLPAGVIASSLAVQTVYPGAVAAGTYSSITLPAANVTAGSFASGAYTFPGNLTISGNLGANLNAGGFRVTNLGAPSAAGDAATKAYVDSATGSLGAAILVSTQTFTGLNTFSNQVTVSSHVVALGQLVAGSGAVAVTTPAGLLDASKLTGNLPGTVIASSIAVGSVQDAAIVSVSGSKITGSVANSSLDSSSVTLQGNTFNTANRLVRLGITGALPAVSGGLLTNLTPGNMDAGALPSTVIASSIAVAAVGDASIVSLSASKLTGPVTSDLQIGQAQASTFSASGFLTLARLTTPPAAARGRLYYDSTTNRLMVSQDGATFVALSTGGASGGDFVSRTGDTMSGPLTLAGSTLTVRGAGSTAATSSLQVANAAGDPSLFVRDDGNVGIGTLSPAYRMEVASPGGVAAQMDTSNPGYMSLRINGVEVARVRP